MANGVAAVNAARAEFARRVPRRLASIAIRRHAAAMRRKARQATKPENRPRLWGRHAVTAALQNPERTIVRISVTREVADQYDFDRSIPVTYADAADLGRLVPRDAPHQGIVADVERLPDIWLGDLLDRAEDGRPLLVLDQVTDPHNVGAILRSAAAFGALGIVTQDRHAPAESGALAKAASGALETVPWVRVVNLSRALDEIAEAGFWRIGLTGEADTDLADAVGPARVALVLGAEGEGMRQNTESHSDALARLPIGEGMESLNVSNAAAIALYAVASARGR
jgi:23S rRNA (guanosine2251-2'-O)-methyltransferase